MGIGKNTEGAREAMKKAWLVTVILIAIIGCVGHQVCLASPQAHSQHQKMQTISQSGFTVNISLSDKAKEQLLVKKETIIVAGYVTGKPKLGALKQYVNRMGEVELGNLRAEITPGGNATFSRVQVKRDAFEQTDKNDPQVLINVFSGRKSSKDNLLDCGIYQGPLKSIELSSAAISCKLIGE
jgi:hypothetical protein